MTAGRERAAARQGVAPLFARSWVRLGDRGSSLQKRSLEVDKGIVEGQHGPKRAQRTEQCVTFMGNFLRAFRRHHELVLLVRLQGNKRGVDHLSLRSGRSGPAFEGRFAWSENGNLLRIIQEQDAILVPKSKEFAPRAISALARLSLLLARPGFGDADSISRPQAPPAPIAPPSRSQDFGYPGGGSRIRSGCATRSRESNPQGEFF